MQESAKIIETIEKYTDFFFTKPIQDNRSLILLYMPYHPYIEREGHYKIDAFYPASNKLYFIIKNLVKELAEFGAERVDNDIKSVFCATKCATVLRNTLVAIPKYGSKVALGAIKINAVLPEILPTITQDDGCLSCNLCVKACPAGALNDGFCRQKCLRNGMDEYSKTDMDFSGLGQSILGCDICQKVCPINNAIQPVEAPKDFLDMLEYQNFDMLLGQGKKSLQLLGEYIGTNYVRPERLKFFCNNAKKNDSKNK